MAHAQKPDFVSPKRASPFKSAGASVQSTAGSRGVRISVSNAGNTTFRGSVKSTGYPLHSSVSPLLPLPCVTVCHHVSNELYNQRPARCMQSSVVYHAARGHILNLSIQKRGKAVPLQAWSSPEGSRKLRLIDIMTTVQDGGKVVSLTHRPPLPPRNTPGIHFC
jgi:hypothetical protein